jgi:hypothetical protein
MLIIPDVTKEALKKAFAAAVDNDSVAELVDRLNYLATYGDNNHSVAFRVTLFPDRFLGDNGFSVLWESRKRGEAEYLHSMNGGLVYHESDSSWGVHT